MIQSLMGMCTIAFLQIIVLLLLDSVGWTHSGVSVVSSDDDLL